MKAKEIIKIRMMMIIIIEVLLMEIVQEREQTKRIYHAHI